MVYVQGVYANNMGGAWARLAGGIDWRQINPTAGIHGVQNVFALLCAARANKMPVRLYLDASGRIERAYM